MDRNGRRFQKLIAQVLCWNAVRDTKIISAATAFDHLRASEEVVEPSIIWLGECQGLLWAWLEGITKCERNPRMLNVQAGAVADVVAEEWHSDGAWMTATGSPRHEGRNWSMGLGPMVTNRLIQLFRDPYPSPLRQVCYNAECRKG